MQKVRWIEVFLAVLFALAVGSTVAYRLSQPPPPPPPTIETGTCDQVWDVHLDSARRFDFLPGNRATFIAECEKARAALAAR